MKCPECGGAKLRKIGKRLNGKRRDNRYLCLSCYRTFWEFAKKRYVPQKTRIQMVEYFWEQVKEGEKSIQVKIFICSCLNIQLKTFDKWIREYSKRQRKRIEKEKLKIEVKKYFDMGLNGKQISKILGISESTISRLKKSIKEENL